VISQDTLPEGANDGRSQGGRDAFSGETFRGNRNPQGVCRIVISALEIKSIRQAKQNPGSRRARPALRSRCLREHAGHKDRDQDAGAGTDLADTIRLAT